MARTPVSSPQALLRPSKWNLHHMKTSLNIPPFVKPTLHNHSCSIRNLKGDPIAFLNISWIKIKHLLIWGPGWTLLFIPATMSASVAPRCWVKGKGGRQQEQERRQCIHAKLFSAPRTVLLWEQSSGTWKIFTKFATYQFPSNSF